jgi:CxxC motif-containing protein (DUF1111 family)
MSRRHATLLLSLLAGCGGTPAADPLSGGSTTVFDVTEGAYADPASNLAGTGLDAFNLGHSVFNGNWVTAPATTADLDGLGPLFNQRSCSSCHSRDGRSRPFDANGALLGMLYRLSVPGADANGGPLGDVVYATQLRPYGILGVPGDGAPVVSYTELPGQYGDGSAYSLQQPTYTVGSWSYGAPDPALMISPRTGPAVIGLGLLEALPESVILANIKSHDPDGVVGKANYVWDTAGQVARLGRFGWKANQPSIAQQTQGALNGDIGITSPLYPNESCTATMTACNAAPRGGQPDIDGNRLSALIFYMQTLAVPARRDVSDAKALHGEQLFADFGCASCHVPTYTTGTLDGVPEVSGQTIHPYTDLLLHDLGPGLADGRPDYLATGTEWRTTPLWGIGLLQQVNGHDLLLHDGRARGIGEAILWHGGEAQKARERFRQASSSDRDALLQFLNSL